VNLCRSCGHDFSSIEMFDAHRVGKHEYLFDSEHLDGRRCLDASEMDAELRMSAAGAQSCRVRAGSGAAR
jgi:hypothetical protein